MPPEPVVVAKGLTKKFKDFTAVNAVDLSIKKGEIYGLLGPNGAGKTTTMSMLSTLLLPTSGTASVNGFDVVLQRDEVRRSLGVVFQEPSTDFKLTGRENLELHCMLYAVPQGFRRERIAEVLGLVELSDWQDKLVKNYSGGMKQRLEIARGILHRPKVLFLDEPTIGLDPQSREHVWRYLSRMVKRERLTVLMTTHYLEEAEKYADRIGIIDHGRLLVEGRPKSIIGRTCFDEITVTGAASVEKLRSLPFVKSVSKKNGSIAIKLKDSPSHLREIVPLIGRGASVQVRRADLNEVFVNYTGHGLRDEE